MYHANRTFSYSYQYGLVNYRPSTLNEWHFSRGHAVMLRYLRHYAYPVRVSRDYFQEDWIYCYLYRRHCSYHPQVIYHQKMIHYHVSPSVKIRKFIQDVFDDFKHYQITQVCDLKLL